MSRARSNAVSVIPFSGGYDDENSEEEEEEDEGECMEIESPL